MRKRTKRWLSALALPVFLALASCPTGDDDDSGTGDDDTTASGNDDDATGNDDDATGNDDDATGSDDDTTGDDDATGDDDDDSTGSDDDNMDYYGVRSDDGSAPRHPSLRDLRTRLT